VGHKFACGTLLHDGECIQQPAPGLFAGPGKMLWEEWKPLARQATVDEALVKVDRVARA